VELSRTKQKAERRRVMRWDQRVECGLIVSTAVSCTQVGVHPVWSIFAGYGVGLCWDVLVFAGRVFAAAWRGEAPP
jgi:hypothetical protein